MIRTTTSTILKKETMTTLSTSHLMTMFLLLTFVSQMVSGTTTTTTNVNLPDDVDGPEGTLSRASNGEWVYQPSGGTVIINDNTHLAGTFDGSLSTGNGQIPFFHDGTDDRGIGGEGEGASASTTSTNAPTASPVAAVSDISSNNRSQVTGGSGGRMSLGRMQGRGSFGRGGRGGGTRNLLRGTATTTTATR